MRPTLESDLIAINVRLGESDNNSAAVLHPVIENQSEYPQPHSSATDRTPRQNHPQFTGPLPFAQSPWFPFIPTRVHQADDPAKLDRAPFSKPQFPGEKVHYFPPFVCASPEDAQEIDEYLQSLPADHISENQIGFHYNAYLTCPVWREPESEIDYALRLKNASSQADALARGAPNAIPTQNANTMAPTHT